MPLKRFISFLFGLLIIIVVGSLALLTVDVPNWWKYSLLFQQYTWIVPTIWGLTALLLLIALGFIIFAFWPSHKKRGLYLKYDDGEIYMNKKSIEKNVQHTVSKYDAVRQPSIDVTMYQTKKASYLDIAVDLLVAQTDNVQTLLTTMREDIKQNVEHFSELPVRDVSINVLDQKALKKRVI